jgi:hypothetical protein
VAVVADVEFVEQRIAPAVEGQLPDPETPAHLAIEGGSDLEHPVVEPERDIAVIDEEVGSHQFGKLRGIQVVANVGKSDRRRDAACPQRGSQQDRLRYAIVR